MEAHIIDRSAASLLFLLDGLLSHDERRIHDSLWQLRNGVRHAAPDLLPPMPMPPPSRRRRTTTHDYVNVDVEDDDNVIVYRTSTTTTFPSTTRPPRITWTISCSNDDDDDAAAAAADGHRSTPTTYRYSLDLCHIIQVALQIRPELAYARTSHDDSTVLHFASSLGNVPIAHVILLQFPESATIPNNKGKIPLHYAAREGRKDMVHFFLDRVPHTASIGTDKRKLALHFAAGDGHVEVCRALLQVYPRGAMLPSAKGKLPLHLCARWGHLEVAYELIRIYPNAVRALDWEGGLPLHDAAREGQLEMSRYLLELFPMALSTVNMRNEIPLFPAVRSGSLDVVALLVQAWPAGSRCILQNISADDNISSGWMSGDILELLLRGAVQKLNGCTLLQGRMPPTARLHTSENWRAVVQPPVPPCWHLQKPKMAMEAMADPKHKKIKVCDTRENDADARYRIRLVTTSLIATEEASDDDNDDDDVVVNTELDVEEVAMSTVMRSKSPVLQERLPAVRRDDKKRTHPSGSSTVVVASTAKPSSSPSSDICFYVPEEQRKFIPLHAALECSASYHVIQYVLDQRYEYDIWERDERGMLPLHWAVAQCNRPQLDTLPERELMIQMILNKLLIVRNNNDDGDDGSHNAAMIRDDVYHRLPLHFALAYRADPRVIRALIAAYPASAVAICHTRDAFRDKTPLHMAIQCDCELDTIFMLLRTDPSFIARERRENSAGK